MADPKGFRDFRIEIPLHKFKLYISTCIIVLELSGLYKEMDLIMIDAVTHNSFQYSVD